MTREEYISVCSKYSDYLNLTGNGSCYIKGAITLSDYQVTGVVYKDFLMQIVMKFIVKFGISVIVQIKRQFKPTQNFVMHTPKKILKSIYNFL